MKNLKSISAVLMQWLGTSLAFIIAMILTDLLLPLPQFILEQTPDTGFMSLAVATMFNGAVNALLLVWMARRSSLRGFALALQLFLVSFLTQTFQTQIETAYFLPAFPLLHGNLEVYRLILRGAMTSALFVLLATLMVGGFSKAQRETSRFTLQSDRTVKTGAWLSAVYFVLYMLFGYFVAWQSQELRIFYGGPAELNSFFDQFSTALIGKPELPVFQFFRGYLWMLCLIPLMKAFTGRRFELIALSALVLGLLPTAQLAFPNPLMPAEVSLYHFWEVGISTALFGGLCAWFVPIEVMKE